MLGISRLTSLSMAASAPAGARSSAATYASWQGTPTFPTTQGKFNGYVSCGSNQVGSITTNPSNTNWYLNADQIWTVEMWLRVSSTTWTSNGSPIINLWPEGSNTGCSLVATSSNTVGLSLGGTTYGTTALSTTFQHYVITNNGAGTAKAYKDGVQFASGTWSNSYNSRIVSFGQPFAAGITFRFDDLRISNIQRYTVNNFTVPSAAFTNDANTLALIHFDGGSATDDTA